MSDLDLDLARPISTDLLSGYRVHVLPTSTDRGRRLVELIREDERPPPSCLICRCDLQYNPLAAFIIVTADIEAPSREMAYAICGRCADDTDCRARVVEALWSQRYELYRHLLGLEQPAGHA
jgi:hypothetical protein